MVLFLPEYRGRLFTDDLAGDLAAGSIGANGPVSDEILHHLERFPTGRAIADGHRGHVVPLDLIPEQTLVGSGQAEECLVFAARVDFAREEKVARPGDDADLAAAAEPGIHAQDVDVAVRTLQKHFAKVSAEAVDGLLLGLAIQAGSDSPGRRRLD